MYEAHMDANRADEIRPYHYSETQGEFCFYTTILHTEIVQFTLTKRVLMW